MSTHGNEWEGSRSQHVVNRAQLEAGLRSCEASRVPAHLRSVRALRHHGMNCAAQHHPHAWLQGVSTGGGLGASAGGMLGASLDGALGASTGATAAAAPLSLTTN